MSRPRNIDRDDVCNQLVAIKITKRDWRALQAQIDAEHARVGGPRPTSGQAIRALIRQHLGLEDKTAAVTIFDAGPALAKTGTK